MTRPLVYACSGCSSAAQLANHLAVRLDREGRAEMSCIAGLGGDVRSLLRTANEAVASGRPIVAIDGCVLACARQTLARHAIVPTRHLELSSRGVRKRLHEDFDPEQAAGLLEECRALVEALGEPMGAGTQGLAAVDATVTRRAPQGAGERALEA